MVPGGALGWGNASPRFIKLKTETVKKWATPARERGRDPNT